jgi:hypothetical protein
MFPQIARGVAATLMLVVAAVICRRLLRQEEKLKSTLRELGGDDANPMTVMRDNAVEAKNHNLVNRLLGYYVWLMVCGLLFGGGVILLFTLFA